MSSPRILTTAATRIAFLIGAGASIPAGKPSTVEITQRVLSGKDIYRMSDSTYSLNGANHPEQIEVEEYVPRVVNFLRSLKEEIDNYYKRQDRVTYEDLYYLASQIHDSELMEYDNPAVQPLIDRIQPDIAPLLIPKEEEIKQDWLLHDLAGETMHFIQDVAWRVLGKKRSECLEYMSILGDAVRDSALSCVDIFTLNHDTVLEEYFIGNGISLTDGFGEPIHNVRYFAPALYTAESRLNLFKLHGSINWFRYDTGIGIPIDWDYWHTLNPQGQRQWPQGGRPVMLVGTFNKILNYTEGIFIELQCQLYHRLSEAARLIVCGYSFGDKAVNTRIVEWMYSSSRTRIIVIDPGGDKGIRNTARGAITKNWDDWTKSSRLVVIPKGIQDTSWTEVRNSLM